MKYNSIDELPKHLQEQAKRKMEESPESQIKAAPRAVSKPRFNKYKNVKVAYDGINFDSKGEAKRYKELKALETVGLIEELRLQPEYILQEGFRNKQGKWNRAIKYIADFEYWDHELNQFVVEDFKGYKTDIFRIKQKLFYKKFPNIWLRIINKKGEIE